MSASRAGRVFRAGEICLYEGFLAYFGNINIHLWQKVPLNAAEHTHGAGTLMRLSIDVRIGQLCDAVCLTELELRHKVVT